jgi:penicillin-binding protein 1A
MWRTIKFFLSLSIVGILAAAGIMFYLQTQLPSVEVLKDVHMQVPLRVYTSDEKLIAEYGTQRRIPVKLQDVPKQMVNAVLAIEDHRFYEHVGVDIRGLMRAGMHVITEGNKGQGGSTITMQVARNFFLTRKKTYIRKVNEILLALKIERELSKDEILELYLNKIYFGKRAYGVAAAAKVYYGKELNDLTLAEAAMIAGLPQAPSSINPINNPEAAKVRRSQVLESMYENGYITQQQLAEADKEPLGARDHGAVVEIDAAYVGEMVRDLLVTKFGEDVYTQGLRVYTTVHSDLQIAANTALRKNLLAYDQRHGYRGPESKMAAGSSESSWKEALQSIPRVGNLPAAVVTSMKGNSITAMLANGHSVTIAPEGLGWANRSSARTAIHVGDVIRVWQVEPEKWRLAQVPKAQAAIVSLNPNNGSILALVGGFDYGRSEFNRAVQGLRQPGSSFKPFIYSAALDNGFTASSIVLDSPFSIRDGVGRIWSPHNSDGKFIGPMRLREALVRSRNAVSVRLVDAVGIDTTISHIGKFGFPTDRIHRGLTLALGTPVFTPLEMATGYAVFANGGYRVQPNYIQRITDLNDKVFYQAKPPTACPSCETNPDAKYADENGDPIAPRAISAQNAFIMNSILEDVIQRGTGQAAKVLGRRDIGGKTGTTNDQIDAWFSGFNANVVTSCWVGFDNPVSTREFGARAALPIWIDYMRVALEGTPESVMSEPADIVTAKIDPRSGLLSDNQTGNGLFEIFMADNLPIRRSGGYADPNGSTHPYGAHGSMANGNNPVVDPNAYNAASRGRYPSRNRGAGVPHSLF